MKTIDIDKEVLFKLDDTRKSKLREKIAKGEVSLNIIDNPLTQKEETKTPDYNDVGNVHLPPVSNNEAQGEKTLWDKTKDFGKKVIDDTSFYLTAGQKRPFGTKNQLLDEVKDIASVGLDGIETGVNFLNPISDFTRDLNVVEDAPEHKNFTEKYNKNKIDDKLISDIKALARTDFRLFGKATQEQKDRYITNVANILHRGGYDLGQDKNGNFVAVDDKGNIKAITNGFFEDIVDGIVADAGEISGAMYGAYKGAEFAKKVPNPLARLLIVLSSSGVGAVTGTAYDTAINELKGDQNLNIEDVLNELSKSAVLDAAGNAIGFGVIKVGGKLIKLPKELKDYIVNGNINGAREILKKDLKISEEFIDDALEQAKQNYKEVEDYTSKGVTGKPKQQEELLAATLEKGDANIIKGAITNNETAARNLSDTIDQRTANIQNELNNKSSKIGGEEIKNYLIGHELSVKNDFNNMRKDFREAFKEVNYKFELEDLNLNSVFKDMSKRVQDPDAKKRFLNFQKSIKNTIYDSNAQVGIQRDIDGLLDLRQQLNSFYGKNEKYLTNKKDKDTFVALKENLDNQIYKAVNDNLPHELATRLIDRFSKSMEKYRELGALSENKVFKGIMGDAQSSEYRMDKLIKHMADDDSYVDDVLSKMPPNARQTVEVAVIRDIIDSFTAKTAGGQKAIAFEDLAKELESIKRNVRSELGKETIENLITYADKFGNKDLLYLDMAKGITTKPKHNISTTLDGKIKVETANMFFQFIQSIKPGNDAKRLALQRHIGKALEKSRTPKEFATNVYEYPELSDESKYILKSLIKENNKLMMAKNDAEAKRLLEELEAKELLKKQQEQKISDEIENFSTPSIYEIRAVDAYTPDDRFGSFSQMTTKIADGTATPYEIEKYVRAKNSIDPELLEKTILKKQYLVNSNAIEKLEALKSFDNKKVDEIVNHNEYKALIYALKNDKLPNTTKNMEEKYRQKFYELNKLYDSLQGQIKISKGIDEILAGKKQKEVLEKVSQKEQEEIVNHFNIKLKHSDNFTRTIDKSQIEHVFKNHGDSKKEEARGNIALTIEDIKNYLNIIHSADIKKYNYNHQNKPVIVYGKQINGHFVVVEEIRTGRSDLAFFTMRKTKGNLTENALMLEKDKPQALRPNTTSSNDSIISNNSAKNQDMDLPKELIDTNKKAYDGMTFEEAEKAGLVPFSNGETLGGAFFGGSETAFNERDWNNDGEVDAEDIALGVIGGAIGFKALAKLFPNWFKGENGINSNKLNKERKNIVKVDMGEKPSTVIKTYDVESLNDFVEFEKGGFNKHTKKGVGFEKIAIRHMKDGSNGFITLDELAQIGNIIRDGEFELKKNGVREYTFWDNDIRYKAIIGENERNERVVSFYSNRRGKGHNARTLFDNPSNGIIITYKPQKTFKEWINGLKTNDDGVIIGSFGGKSPIIEKDFKDKDGFYSTLETIIDKKVGGKIDTISLSKMLEKNGVKEDELEWSGLKELIKNNKKLTKEQIQETLKENRLNIEVVSVNNTKYKEYTLKGGENYKELLFRAPKIDGSYETQHWDKSNILVFTRVDDRAIDNKKTLFIEELQSDWHQDGRKVGYKKETNISSNQRKKVPNAPFKKNWAELGFKRMIQEAVVNDYDKIAWTTGQQQVKRYSLEKELDTIVYNKNTGYIQGSKNADEVVFKKVSSDEEVEAMLGKELTKRLINPKSSTKNEIYVLKGEDLKFGGDGMKTFYDKIIPNIVKKLFKKYKVKPKMEELDDIDEMVWSIDITSQMKKAIKKYGQPLYIKGTESLAAGSIAGIEKDENGNLTLNPEKFILGMAMVTGAKKSAKFIIDKTLEKSFREQQVKQIPKEVFKQLGVKENRVYADYIQLATKHPEYFEHPREAKELVEYVLQKPTYSLKATKKDYDFLVRTNGKDKGTVVEFELKGGKYRVKSAFILSDGQLETKFKKAKELGEPILQFQYVN